MMNYDTTDYGLLLSEHRRTWWSFAMFVVFFLYLFLMALSSVLAMISVIVIGNQWEMPNYFLVLFFGGFTVWFAKWIWHRFSGIYYVAIYQKGVLVKNYFGEKFIIWETIEDVKSKKMLFQILLFFVIWRTLTIQHCDGIIVIESGTGFTFSDWPHLFALESGNLLTFHIHFQQACPFKNDNSPLPTISHFSFLI